MHQIETFLTTVGSCDKIECMRGIAVLSNQKGETLITVIISITVLFVIAAFTAPLLVRNTNTAKNNSEPNAICRETAINVVNLIRSEGIQSKYYNASMGRDSVRLSDSRWHRGEYSFNPDGVKTEAGVIGELENLRWPNQRAMDWNSGSGNYRSNTPLLIHSSVNSLQTIYNAFSNQACTSGLTITSSNALSSLFPGDRRATYRLRTGIFIRPYEWSTGNILPCSSPLYLRPYSNEEPPVAQRLGMADFSKFRADRGFEVEVNVEVRNENNEAYVTNCSIKERFQFDRNTSEAPAPVVTSSGTQFTFRNPMPAGTHMICRSTHYFLDPLGRIMSGDTSTGTPSAWMPCDRLTACGQSGSTSYDHSDSSITKNFSSLPGNCVLHFEVKTFDATGNVSNTQSANYMGGITSTPPDYDESPSGGGGGGTGYEVGGLQFETRQAAARASQVSGFPINTIGEVTAGMDAIMNSVHSSLTGAANGNTTASGHAATAQGALSTAQNAANSAGVPGGSASSARSSANNARSAANTASSAAASARSAADAARAAADAVSASAGALGAIGDAAVAEAQAAADEAEKAAEQAEEAARLAEEAARKAEEEAKAKEEAEREAERNEQENT